MSTTTHPPPMIWWNYTRNMVFRFFRYIIYAIKDEKQIVVEKVGNRDAKYQDFVQDLLAAGPDDCRYGVFDYEYEHMVQGATSGSQKQKLILLSWYG